MFILYNGPKVILHLYNTKFQPTKLRYLNVCQWYRLNAVHGQIWTFQREVYFDMFIRHIYKRIGFFYIPNLWQHYLIFSNFFFTEFFQILFWVSPRHSIFHFFFGGKEEGGLYLKITGFYRTLLKIKTCQNYKLLINILVIILKKLYEKHRSRLLYYIVCSMW